MERLFEEVFVEVCAPTLRGIKPSNLFRYQPQNRDKLLEALDFWNRELEPAPCLQQLHRRLGLVLLQLR